MANLTAARSTLKKVSPYDMPHEMVMATGATIYKGSGVAFGSDGKIVHASQAGAIATAGVAEQTQLAAAAGQTIKFSSGVKCFANSGAFPLTIANRGQACYWSDDQTVGTDSTKLFAGIVYDVDSDGVWVKMGLVLAEAAQAGALLATNNLSDVVNANTALTNLGGAKRYVTINVKDLVSANASRNLIQSPCAGTITKAYAVTSGAALTGGNATLTGKINGVAITNGVITMTQAASAISDKFSCTPTAANTVVAGDLIEFLVGGTQTATGAYTQIVVEITLPAT
jgi:hypothetical protein